MPLSEPRGSAIRFPGDCCFPVIYFGRRIFFVRPVAMFDAGVVETFSLSRARKTTGSARWLKLAVGAGPGTPRKILMERKLWREN
jgi:hypothetical protein